MIEIDASLIGKRGLLAVVPESEAKIVVIKDVGSPAELEREKVPPFFGKCSDKDRDFLLWIGDFSVKAKFVRFSRHLSTSTQNAGGAPARFTKKSSEQRQNLLILHPQLYRI
ncbi:hypothetical protein HGB47_09915 [Leptospira yasudae]|uniref:hypothetical protein n=1 Tax=Leptospira yasudae TaxID=2202201 RepID=UPI001C4F065D|nr:hypothetical protein [Leptospira yasudae]MBW0433933.1 hypothetical protein [Leptospira yasudae]